jgi:hypothetical protein
MRQAQCMHMPYYIAICVAPGYTLLFHIIF